MTEKSMADLRAELKKSEARFDEQAKTLAAVKEDLQRSNARFRDIEDRSQADSAITEKTALLQSILDAVPANISVRDTENRFLFVSNHAAAELGIKPREFIGKTISDLLGPASDHTVDAIVDEVLVTEKPIIGREIQPPRRPGSTYVYNVIPLFDDIGALTGAMTLGLDITAVKEFEETLRKSEKRYRELADMLPLSICESDANGLITYANQMALDTYGYSEKELDDGLTILETISPDEHEILARNMEKILQHGEKQVTGNEYIAIRKDGAEFPVFIYTSPSMNGDRPTGIRSVIVDITEQKVAEQTLKDSEKRFRKLIEGSAVGFVIHSDWKALFANQAAANIFGYGSPEDIVALDSLRHWVAAHEYDRLIKFSNDRNAGREAPEHYEYEGVRKDGSSVWILTNSRVIDWYGQRAIQNVFYDITDRKQAERTLRASEALYTTILDNTPTPIGLKACDGRYLLVNKIYAGMRGMRADEIKEKAASDIWPRDVAERLKAEDRQVIRTGSVVESEMESLGADGVRRYYRGVKFPIFGDNGDVASLGSVYSDITERKQSEILLEESQTRLRDFAELGVDLLWEMDENLRFTYMSTNVSQMGAESNIYIGKTYLELRYDDSDMEGLNAELKELNARNQYVCERESISIPGRFVQNSAKPLFSEDGTFLGYRGVLRDITERKITEGKFLRSQRMETAGQLSGGVAHDFNNLMAAMLGNAELLERRINGDKKSLRYIQQIKKAVLRGTSLTDRLLAFSRKQTLLPRVTDIDGLIGGLDDMLRRTLGETIDLNVVPNAKLWPSMIDSSQLEHALINLVVNSRDAMPKGGVLTIEATNVSFDEGNLDLRHAAGMEESDMLRAMRHHHAKSWEGGDSEDLLLDDMPRRRSTDFPEEATKGDYVKVTVSDNGTGMTAEVHAKVFEPFFTTKEVGQGSGLGLSMVYGFAKQSGGHVSIHSVVDEGTTVSIFLPRSQENIIENIAAEARKTPRGSERILVVEDDLSVLEVLVSYLREQGYAITEATNGEEAVIRLQEGPYDLLYTDIVLPGAMNGLDVAKAATRLQPGIKVLYTTGYAEDAVVHDGLLNDADTIIRKPYELSALAEKVRLVLDAKSD